MLNKIDLTMEYFFNRRLKYLKTGSTPLRLVSVLVAS
jgi:hypothetical protein